MHIIGHIHGGKTYLDQRWYTCQFRISQIDDKRTSSVLILCVIFPFDFSSVNMPDNMCAELLTVVSVVTHIALFEIPYSSLFEISAVSLSLSIVSLIHIISFHRFQCPFIVSFASFPFDFCKYAVCGVPVN